MRKHLYSILIFGMCAVSGAFSGGTGGSDWGEVTNNVQISLTLKGGQREIKTTAPVPLLVGFRNLSTNQTVGVFRTGAVEYDDTYSWVVISPSGKDVSPDFRTIPTCDNGHTLYIPPAHTNQVELNFRNLCRFDEVGTYKIVAKKQIWLGVNKRWLAISNPLLVSIASDQ
jgi:hypothetical protein